LRHLGQANKLKTSFEVTYVSLKKKMGKREKKKKQKQNNMAGTSKLLANKILRFLQVFKGNRGQKVHRIASQETPHSSFIHFVSPMPTMSPSSILTSKHQKPVCRQFSDFYKISCSYYRSFM